MSGLINVLNTDAATSLNFNFQIVSTVFSTVTVFVQDELTFFGVGNPLVNGSRITLTNQVTNAVVSATAPLGQVKNKKEMNE